MASYSLVSSYSTVQVLSPTLTRPVQYVTIQSQPSGVLASMVIDEADFTGGTSGTLLTDFSDAIEIIMARPEVVAGVGQQQIDQSGLLADYVTFTVQYAAANTAPSGVTAEADVPVGLLSTAETFGGRTNMPEVVAIITAAYDSLAAAAGPVPSTATATAGQRTATGLTP